MTRALGRRLTLLATLAFAPAAAAAQTAVQSFADLQPILAAGQKIVVIGVDGRKTRGTVVSLAGGQLEISEPRAFRRAERRVIGEDSIRRIDRQDSDWNGILIGAGAGALGILGLLRLPACNRPDNWSRALFIEAAVPIGMVIGGAIDHAITMPVYVASRRTAVTLSPWVTRAQVGLMARVSF